MTSIWWASISVRTLIFRKISMTANLCKNLALLHCLVSGYIFICPRVPLAATGYVDNTTAQIELCSGKAAIVSQANGVLQSVQNGMPLTNGAILQTAAETNSRCRVVFSNGDAVHVGAGSHISLVNHEDGANSLKLLKGQLVGYAMPRIEGRAHPLRLETTAGALELMTGKVFLSQLGTKTQLAVFSDLAHWRDKQGDQHIMAGQMATFSASDTLALAATPQNRELEVSTQNNPEIPAVSQALRAFHNKDMATAGQILSQVQLAFPYNGVAAYYLGLFSLNAGDLPTAIKHWQKYVLIDPKGAGEKHVKQHLTLLVTQSIKEEVQQAIKNENSISSLPPEPNSIAVHPLINKGDKKYLPIGKGITALVISDLAKVPGLKVLEREKIQKLLDEIKLSEHGPVDESTAVRSGKLLHAEKLMIGDYKIAAEKRRP
jgi:tetratricopeptide (TPR) repeat protein